MLVEFTLGGRGESHSKAAKVHIDAGSVEFVTEDTSSPGVCSVQVRGHKGIVVRGTADEAARRINDALASPRPDYPTAQPSGSTSEWNPVGLRSQPGTM
jgi:hypothetical protein